MDEAHAAAAVAGHAARSESFKFAGPVPMYVGMATITQGAFGEADAGLILEILQHNRPAWHADAACREAPYDVSWFEEGPYCQEQAKLICSRCLVVDECLAWAEAEGPDLAWVWGGLDRQERAARRRQRSGEDGSRPQRERESA